MMDLIWRFLSEMLTLLGEMAPYLTLGFIFAGLLHVFVPKNAVARHLGGETAGSAVRGALMGIPLPLCSCGTVPTAMGLRKRGASRASVVSFLISTPQTGLDAILATYGFFGWLFAIFRPVAAFISGVLGGIATRLFTRGSAAEDDHWMTYHVRAEDALEENGGRSIGQRLAGGMNFAFRELLGDIALWLVVGLAVAAAMALIVPDDFFARKVQGELPQMLMMIALSVPLYVCSTGSIPIAAVLIAKGISPGAAFVFLMCGPASNAGTLVIIGRVMGGRVLSLYLGSITITAVAMGFILNGVIAQTGWAVAAPMTHDHSMLPAWLTYGTSLLLAALMVWHFVEWFRIKFSGRNIMTSNGKGFDLTVEGMNCSHCVRTVTETLKSVPGVNVVNVTLENGLAHVEGENLDRATLANAVTGVGYKVKS
ncbi:MAG TPA: SO_0444 family Cu/Zn efflux transporter [bacterium]|jgi:hypothetical protein